MIVRYHRAVVVLHWLLAALVLFSLLASRIGHFSLYAAVILMAASGIALALQAGIPAAVFGAGALPNRSTLTRRAPRTACSPGCCSR